MNQPFAVPLFLPRPSSDHSQPKAWRTAASHHPGRQAWARLGELRLTVRARRSTMDTAPAAAPARAATGGATATEGGPTTGGAPVTDGRAVGSGTGRSDRSRAVWAMVISGMALFMASLDNLVVSTALPVIRVHLHAGLSGLEWTVNAYTLTFAVLLLSAAAVGERFGRRRTFVTGIAVFTAASALAALAPTIGMLIVARAIQGAGGAMMLTVATELVTLPPPLLATI